MRPESICLQPRRASDIRVKVNFIQLARKTAARRADGPTEITAADEHRKTVWQRKQNLEDLGRKSCASRGFFGTHYIRVDAMSRAVTKKQSPVKKRCFWWEDYVHLVKQAQKPNVNRKASWEGEEEEGKSAAHIPVMKDKSLSAALRMTFGSAAFIFWWAFGHLTVVLLILRALLIWSLCINSFMFWKFVKIMSWMLINLIYFINITWAFFSFSFLSFLCVCTYWWFSNRPILYEAPRRI